MTATDFDFAAGHFADERTPFLSARRVSELLGVTMVELSRLIGVARNTLTAKSG